MPVGGVLISVAIESALGVQDMAAIACASPRVISLSLGAEDFCRDIGVEPSPNGEEQLYGRGMVVVAARVAGVQASGLTSTLANFGDMEGMRRSATHARTLGFRGASCIHPGMVQILNEAYSPDADAVAYARRVIEVYDAAEAEGRASVALDGKMIDIPVVERARTLVQRADAIAALEAQKAQALAALGA
jgi:citrate lyase subunit beta/citryl-CoA lyase